MNRHQENHAALNSSAYVVENNWDLKKIYAQLNQQKWLILFCGIIGVGYMYIKIFSIPQEYQSSALIQVFEKGSGVSTSFLSTVGLNKGASPVKAELTLLKTRYILEPVVLESKLHISTKPFYFPVFGEWKATRYQGKGLAKPFLGLKKYAWGGEKIKLTNFTVPDEYVGREFYLIAQKNKRFKLFFSKGNLILEGGVGKEVASPSYPGFLINIEELQARADTEFEIIYQSPLWLSQELISDLFISAVPLDTGTRDTGIMQIAFKGESAQKVETALNAMVDHLIKVNIQNKSRDAQKTWDFLNSRLPKLKERIEGTEGEINQYLVKHHTLNSGQVGQLLMMRYVNTEHAIGLLREKYEKLLQIYTPQYPLVIALQAQEKSLKQKLKLIDEELKKFYITYQPQLNLEREMKLKDKLYLTTLNNMQQLEIVQAGLTPDIVALGKVLPATPIPTKNRRKIISGFIVGVFLGSIYVLVRNALREPVESAEQLEEKFSIPVRAIIAYSRKQKRMEQNNKKTVGMTAFRDLPIILVKQAPDDIVAESFRSLRVSLGIMNSLKGHHVIAIMGGVAGIGKSFVSLNLAHTFVESGNRTLLIDADLRRGYLEKALFKSKGPGLSEFLEGKITAPEEIIQPVYDNFYFISSGHFKKQPTELFHQDRFPGLLKKLGEGFDQVIIDTPPVLPVADSMLIAPLCDVRLYVVGVPKDDMQSVKRAINRLRMHGVDVDGLVLNYQQVSSLKNLSENYYRYDYKPREEREVISRETVE